MYVIPLFFNVKKRWTEHSSGAEGTSEAEASRLYMVGQLGRDPGEWTGSGRHWSQGGQDRLPKQCHPGNPRAPASFPMHPSCPQQMVPVRSSPLPATLDCNPRAEFPGLWGFSSSAGIKRSHSPPASGLQSSWAPLPTLSPAPTVSPRTPGSPSYAPPATSTFPPAPQRHCRCHSQDNRLCAPITPRTTIPVK